MGDNIIKFKSDTAFRKKFFVPNSFSHPAKMSAPLLVWIVEHFTSEGETILDPMFGSGTTMLACTLGRNVIGVELESKFCDMAKANWEVVKMHPQLGSEMGTCQILQGDARNLEGLLCDKIVTSPPYAEINIIGETKGSASPNRKSYNPRYDDKSSEGYNRDNPSNIGNLPYGDIDKCVFSPPYSLTVQKGHEGVQAWKVIEGLKDADNKTIQEKSKRLLAEGEILNQYGDDPANIGALPYGNIDAVVTSPPYEGSIIDGNENFEGMRHLGTINEENIAKKREQLRAYQFGKETTAYGKKQVDSIVTSPPYEASLQGEQKESDRQHDLQRGRNPDAPGACIKGYTNKVDSIVTSPPYEGALTSSSQHGDTGIARDNPKLADTGRYKAENSENIGNLKSTSYLEAMSQVYSQCHAVLKPQGLMVLVTKNFIRNQKEIRLDLDTIKLCEQAGFTFKERWYRELTSLSFWRIIYKQRYPQAPVLKYEDILVFRK